MIIEDFLNGIEVSEPGIVINYQDEYAWTNGEYIELIDNKYYKYYSFRNGLKLNDSDYKANHEYNLVNIFQFFDSILFVCSDCTILECDWFYKIMLYSFKNGLISEKYIVIEEFNIYSFPYYENIHKEYKTFIFKYDEIFLFGILGIYIINPFKLEMKEKIIFSEKIIQNAYYLNNSFFLIFGKRLFDNLWNKMDDEKESKSKVLKYSCDFIIIMKILENSGQIIFEKLLNFKSDKIYYNQNNNKNNIFDFNNKFISAKNDKIFAYELIDITKKIEMKNNNKF